MFLGNTLTLQEQFFITHTKFLVLKMFETALILLYLTAVVKTKEEGVYFKVRENHFLFDEKTVWDQKVDSLLSCSQICGRRNDCKYVNFKKDQGICSTSDRQSSGKVVQRKGYFYLKKVGYLSVIFNSCDSQFFVEEMDLEDDCKTYLHLVRRPIKKNYTREGGLSV